MRITQDAYYRSVSADLMRLQNSQLDTQNSINTQKKVNVPSDGRGSSYAILSSNLAISLADQYKTNLSQAQSWMKDSDTSVQSLSDLIKRAQVLAEQMSTGTYSSDNQLTTSSEVQNIIDEITRVINSQSQGSFLFSGTRSATAPINQALVCADPSTVSDASTVGHGTQSSVYLSGGSYYLRLSRDFSGAGNTITVPDNALTNTLGAGLGLDFDTWTHSQTASASAADVWTSGAALAAPTSAVSNRIGEVLNWDGAAGAGTQTFATTGIVSFSGAGAGNTITLTPSVGPAQVYTLAGGTAAATAANLVEQINAAGAGCQAWLDSTGTQVNIGSTNYATTFDLSGVGGNMSVDNTTTLQELSNQINSGKQAVGTVHLDDTLPANLPIATDTITLDTNSWNWGQICPAQVSFSGAAAGVAQVNVGGTTYTVNGTDAATSAQDLASQINAGNTLRAQVVGGNQVYVHSLAGGAYLNAAVVADPNAVTTATAAPPSTAAGFAQDLADFINAHTTDYTASSSADGSGATVQVTAKATGTAHNVALTATNSGGSTAVVNTSGTLLGGMNGDDTQGKLFLDGQSSLRLATTVRAQVTAVDPASGAVTLHLSWYGDDGSAQSADVPLPSSGQSNAVNVPGLGGLSLYRDGQSFKLGSVMELDVGHYQGNQEGMAVNFSTNQRLTYNINAAQLLGSAMTVNLDGQQARAGSANTGGGTVQLSGAYRGVLDRDLTINVVKAGQVPDSDVTLRVSWTDDGGAQQQQDVTFSASGSGGKVQLPGGDGIYLQVDNGSFQAGDSFTYHVAQNQVQVLDNLNQWLYQLQNGTQEQAQTQSQHTLQALNQALTNLTNYQAESGARQDRITVRSNVLDDSKQNNSQTLSDLQDVDLTQAFIDLQRQQTTYQSTLRVISTVSQLNLLTYL